MPYRESPLPSGPLAPGLIIDHPSRESRIGSARIELTFREFELLDFLAPTPGGSSRVNSCSGESGGATRPRALARSTCTYTACAASSAPGTASAWSQYGASDTSSPRRPAAHQAGKRHRRHPDPSWPCRPSTPPGRSPSALAGGMSLAARGEGVVREIAAPCHSAAPRNYLARHRRVRRQPDRHAVARHRQAAHRRPAWLGRGARRGHREPDLRLPGRSGPGRAAGERRPGIMAGPAVVLGIAVTAVRRGRETCENKRRGTGHAPCPATVSPPPRA
jgi:hypothetical protein